MWIVGWSGSVDHHHSPALVHIVSSIDTVHEPQGPT